MTIIMAFLEMIGVASIMPFVAVLTNSELVETNIYLIKMYKLSSIFGVENKNDFLFLLGIIVFILLILSISFKALTQYAKEKYVEMRIYSISGRLMKKYMCQPYSWFLNRNSADLEKTILSEVATVVIGNIAPIIELTSKTMIAIALVALLLINDTKLTLIIFFIFILFYGSIYIFSRKYLSFLGEEKLKSNQLRFTSVSEAFGGIKEIKLGGLEKFYTERFSQSAKIFSQRQVTARLFKVLPRYVLETIAFGGVLLVILLLMSQKGSFQNALPFIAVYIFAGYRLLPAFQSIYASINELRFAGPSLDNLFDEFQKLKALNLDKRKDILRLNKTINLKNISFNYPNTSKLALKNINLIIPAKTSIGLIGATGSGKTTLVDIILGLLEVKEGILEIDDQIITNENLRTWQNNIGYVPQNIYLADDTVAANIAFGVKPEDIDQNAIEQAAKNANIHNFVINELPKKYQTTVGERGVRLSGGQHQRIGIARALYHNPQVLIFDEATSALDNQTEKVIMETVYKLSKDITVILIAHRLSTLKNCESIFLLDKGQLKEQGSFEKLIKFNEQFVDTAKNV
ncbi:ABC transporter ATP-binding protein [Pelagibacterales bacterium SAG-MED49]|nr:ABC transporter ATP-binding protein [Pelagibacterales bacterium SAG-MED49]